MRFLRILYATVCFTIGYLFPIHLLQAQQKVENISHGSQIIDSWHYSHVFGEIRKYRIFLPAGYGDPPNKRYPVIYFLHGWSQRYFGPVGDDYSNHDQGDENDGDNILNFVKSHEAIVVKLDGYNKYPDEPYDLTPYNIGEVKTFRQFPIYFPEFVDYIDANYRTLADRDHRAIAGLSMGGFTSFWIGGKYPHLVSAVGNFCGSPEFFAGPLKFPVEYRNIDMYDNYGGVNVRFHYGNRDNLRFYHEDMNGVWPQVMDNYEYKIFDAAHSTCGMGEMFEFMLETFKNPPPPPEKWDHIDVYPNFSIWDYTINSNRSRGGFTILENVEQRGFKCTVREFLPDGELMPFVELSITTPPMYEKDQSYLINDIDAERSTSHQWTVRSDQRGRLKINIDGGSHNIGINKMKDHPNIVFASTEVVNMPWALTNKEVAISVSLLNKGNAAAEDIKVKLSATRNHVTVIDSESYIDKLGVNEIEKCLTPFTFNVVSDSIEISRFNLTISDRNNNEWSECFEIQLKRDRPFFRNYEIADGRTFTVAEAAVDSTTLLLGEGNGDGMANPGETIVVLVKDQGRYWRTQLHTEDPNINPAGVNMRMSDSWGAYDYVGGSAKISFPVISSNCPLNREIVFFGEYWIPNNRDHIIKQGKIKLVVSGKDTSPPKLRWVQVMSDNSIQARVYDGGEIKQVKARCIAVPDVKLDYVNLEEPTEVLELELNDKGLDGDPVEGDGVYGIKIPKQSAYFYCVEIEAHDIYGNTSVERSPEVFVVY